MEVDMNPPTKRKLHSRSGCATCRRRRVRCDERREVCRNCERLGLSCAWYNAADLSHRSRINTACDRCRYKKVRCTSAWSTGPCEPCQAAGAQCVNGKGSQRRPSELSEASPVLSVATRPEAGGGSSKISSFPDAREQRRLLEAYFSGPHFFCFYTFIHPPTFLQMHQDGSVPESLLLIVLATTLRFTEPQNALPDLWADKCRSLIMNEILEPPSTTTLQALLLLQRYEWHRASHISAWFLSGLAVRLAHGLQLNVEIMDKARVPPTMREIRRRLTWSCFIMESMIEAGRSPLGGINASKIEVKVPCNETSFQQGLETDMPELDSLSDFQTTWNADFGANSASRPGISSFMIKLAALRRDILDYTLPYHPRNKGHIPSADPWTQDSPFFEYELKLEQWCSSLPEDLTFNADVMYRRRSQLVTLVTLHCLFHGCYCDLYRIGSYVTASHNSTAADQPLRGPSRSFLSTCKRGRLQHALAICRVISASLEYQQDHDPVVGISASLALRVLVIERQQEDSIALGLTDEIVNTHLDAAVRCGKEIAKRSVPIRELFCSVCALAEQHGYKVDLSDIIPRDLSTCGPEAAQVPERASSPSLRTYGTFGSIQNSLVVRKDILAPAASSSTEKDSDLFSNYKPKQRSQPAALQGHCQVGRSVLDVASQPWELNQPLFPTEGFSPNDLGMAAGWADGTLNFSMMPSQFNWISQDLDFDFSYYGATDGSGMYEQ